jgi:hypothetical protein
MVFPSVLYCTTSVWTALRPTNEAVMQGRRAEHNEASGWRCLGALVNHMGPFTTLQTAVAGFLAMQCTCPILNWGSTQDSQ